MFDFKDLLCVLCSKKLLQNNYIVCFDNINKYIDCIEYRCDSCKIFDYYNFSSNTLMARWFVSNEFTMKQYYNPNELHFKLRHKYGSIFKFNKVLDFNYEEIDKIYNKISKTRLLL